MFYNSGEVISDQFNHIALDSKSGKFWKKSANTRSFGNFFPLRGGGSPIPKSICQNGYQKVNILMKTKNAPKDLKCKINHTFFFWKQGFPKGGEGGGGPTFGKNSPNFPFGWRPLSLLCDINCNANCNDGGARPRWSTQYNNKAVDYPRKITKEGEGGLV